MANYPKYTLTGKTPAATYESLVQYNVESASLVNGYGNDLPQLNITTSMAVTASWAPAVPTISSSYATTASYVSNLYPQTYQISGSWASSSLSASYAPTITTGLTSTQSWVDEGTQLTQSMYINNGLIISWSVAP